MLLTVEDIAELIPTEVANIQLPDPDLLDFYQSREKREYWLNGDIDQSTLMIAKEIYKINIQDKGIPTENRLPIKIFINTPGGDIEVLWQVMNAIKLSKTPVWTINWADSMSAGSHLLAAGHKRLAMPGSVAMLHDGSISLSGDVNKAESAKKYIDSIVKHLKDHLLEHTKVDEKTLKKKGAADWYLDDEDQLKYGLVDEIISDLDDLDTTK